MSNTDPCAFFYEYRWPDVTETYVATLPEAEQVRWREMVKLLEDRDKALEDRLNNRSCGGSGVIVFNFPGVFFTGFSDRYYPPFGVTFRRFAASLTGSGTTDTTVDVTKNGAVLTSLTVAGGANLSAPQDRRVTFGGMADALQFHITGVGAGASGLVCVASP